MIQLISPILAILTAAGMLVSASGCGGESSATEQDTVVYVCTEDKTLVNAPVQPTPAEHPETGRPTLLRALYCKTCDKWHAVPPPAVYPRDPLSYVCPRHDQPMSAEGPLDSPVQVADAGRRRR